MKDCFFGSIVRFDTTQGAEYIEIASHVKELLDPFSLYHVEPAHTIEFTATNCVRYSFKPTSLVINYHKKVLKESKSGILGLREFSSLHYKRDCIVYYEVYKVLSPFTLKEFTDGSFIYLFFEDLKIPIEVSISGVIVKLSQNTYKCKFLRNNYRIIIKGKDFNMEITSVLAKQGRKDCYALNNVEEYIYVTIINDKIIDSSGFNRTIDEIMDDYDEPLSLNNLNISLGEVPELNTTTNHKSLTGIDAYVSHKESTLYRLEEDKIVPKSKSTNIEYSVCKGFLQIQIPKEVLDKDKVIFRDKELIVRLLKRQIIYLQTILDLGSLLHIKLRNDKE